MWLQNIQDATAFRQWFFTNKNRSARKLRKEINTKLPVDEIKSMNSNYLQATETKVTGEGTMELKKDEIKEKPSDSQNPERKRWYVLPRVLVITQEDIYNKIKTVLDSPLDIKESWLNPKRPKHALNKSLKILSVMEKELLLDYVKETPTGGAAYYYRIRPMVRKIKEGCSDIDFYHENALIISQSSIDGYKENEIQYKALERLKKYMETIANILEPFKKKQDIV